MMPAQAQTATSCSDCRVASSSARMVAPTPIRVSRWSQLVTIAATIPMVPARITENPDISVQISTTSGASM